ncbi:hypothetical protein NDU88_007955, partial [Pleurodeles waltl]
FPILDQLELVLWTQRGRDKELGGTHCRPRNSLGVTSTSGITPGVLEETSRCFKGESSQAAALRSREELIEHQRV